MSNKPTSQDKRSHLFLSYSRNDEDLVKTLSKAIKSRGWNTWIDRKSIPSASEWMSEIRRGIEAADGFVFVITPHSLASRMCRVELSIALDLSKRVLPLLPLTNASWDAALEDIHQNIDAGYKDEVPPELRKLDYIDINDFIGQQEPMEALVDELVTAASQDLEWLRMHTRLQHDVKRWVDGRYTNSALLRGSLLLAAEAMLSAKDKDPPLTELQREFVLKSRAEFQKSLEREANQLARWMFDLEDTRIATGVMLALEGLQRYTSTPLLLGALRTLLSRWPQYYLIPHQSVVTSASFSSEGKVILTSSLDGLARLVDIATGKELESFGKTGVPMMKALLSGDSRRIYAACDDGQVWIFERKTGKSSSIPVCNKAVNDLEIDVNGRVMVAIAEDQALILELESFRRHQFPHPDKIRRVVIHQRHVITSCHDGKIRFFNLDTSEIEEFSYQGYFFNDVCISQGSDWMALSGPFAGVLIVDLHERTVSQTLDTQEQSALLMASSLDGRYLAATDIWGKVYTFEVANGELLKTQRVFSRPVQFIIITNDGSLLAAASDFGVVVISNIESEGKWLCAGHDGQVVRMAFDPRGEFLLTAGVDKTARLFGVGRVPGSVMLPHDNAALHIAFSPNGEFLATSARDNVVRVFSLPEGEQVSQYEEKHGELLSAEFITDNELIVACATGRISFIGALSGKENRSFMVDPIASNSIVKISGDHQWCATCQFDEVKHIVSTKGDCVTPNVHRWREIEIELATQMGLLSGQRKIVHKEGGQAPVLEANGKTIYLGVGNFQVINGRFSPDGSVVVGAALNSPHVPVFDSNTGELIATLKMNHYSNDVIFNTQGNRVAASWLNAVTVINYPSITDLLKIAQSQVHRQLTENERAEFGILEKEEQSTL